ncbi:MAG: helix-turn-helix domain-containing protein [Actinomycetota bacterium]|nr:helix-turn-helix domain-containing protein [Actinomycetota bacterium]
MSAAAVKVDGSKIRDLRKALNLSQRDAAKKIGISQPHLSRLERGGWTTPYQTAQKIAKVLGVKVGWLLEKMPEDVRRGSDSLLLAWMDLIEGKTGELRKAVDAAEKPEEVPMGLAVEVERLHKDVTAYAGPRLGLERGESKIALALDDMKFAVEDAYKARFGASFPDPERLVERVIAEEEGEMVKKSA